MWSRQYLTTASFAPSSVQFELHGSWSKPASSSAMNAAAPLTVSPQPPFFSNS